MDRRINDLVATTKEKFGLDSYYLKRYRLNRHVNIFQKTIYTLSMEWFPYDVEEPKDDLNPVGAAVIEMDIHSCQYVSVIFVQDTTYAKEGINFANRDINYIINWIKQETGLNFEKQFQLQKEEAGRLLFNEVFEGVKVSSYGSIEIKYNHEGDLTLFSVNGHFPTDDMVQKETYTLKLDKLENLPKDLLQLINFPSYEEEKLVPIYGVEEVYITNDQMRKIPFEFFFDVNAYTPINEKISYDQEVKGLFEQEDINPIEEITVEQAFSCEKSPESYPITKEEQEACLLSVKELLSQKYPNDLGRWILKTLHREKNYIHAVLRLDNQDHFVFHRKITIILDATNYRPINYIDNKMMLDMFEKFQKPTEINISKEEAYEKLKNYYELQPYYVYDFEQKQYILCGKIDCHYGVNAVTGELVSFDDF